MQRDREQSPNLSTGDVDQPPRRNRRARVNAILQICAGFATVVVLSGAACDTTPSDVYIGLPIYNNTTDKTNNGASYLTSAACQACHSSFAEKHALHGHAHALTRILGSAPVFPPQAPTAGVPNPPSGFSWTDISYVRDGYAKNGRFLDNNGYQLTTGLTGQPTQWNLGLAALGVAAQFVDYLPAAVTVTPYDFDTFRYETTGPQAQDPMNPLIQDSRPGIPGTWVETGVQCESCHGPGSKHVPRPSARNLFVDATGTRTCAECHTRPFGSTTGEILAADGFIRDRQQWDELKASGGHSGFACTYCHNPHESVIYNRSAAIRNACTACHDDANMALHKGKVFVRGDYREELSCESCHMPFATRNGASAPNAFVGPYGRQGDTRTHIFRISTENKTYVNMFTPDGSQVVRDSEGRAAVTADVVCLRCHNPYSLPTLAFTPARAAEIAIGVHRPPQPP